MTKDISGYSPYNAAMRKTAGEVEVRQVQAPEGKIEVKHMGAKKRMPATGRIPVSRTVWAELARLKKPGETYDHLLAEMIEREKMTGSLRTWTASRRGASLWRWNGRLQCGY